MDNFMTVLAIFWLITSLAAIIINVMTIYKGIKENRKKNELIKLLDLTIDDLRTNIRNKYFKEIKEVQDENNEEDTRNIQ